MDTSKIFDAARSGDVAQVRASLQAGADPAAVNDYGFTALQQAAMGANDSEIAPNLAVLKLLIDAGSPLEFQRDGRTALYLAAEFAPSTDAVQLLIDAGAQADIRDSHGNHITVNAMMPEVQELLSALTGVAIEAPEPEPEPAPVKLTAAQWRAAQAKLDTLFETLTQAGLVALQDTGTTQSDGFSDCAEIFHERGGLSAGVLGFCFYTRQDRNRAKREGRLDLAFWGAPDGEYADMLKVGDLIVSAAEAAGLPVTWHRSAAKRPSVLLY
ncbi:ankyrin repeat domain-containing protein [Achromobacter seleniivolatilans]|uniref:Ankyrin repeat domain-containing protein n=1 Tax=Achromobacter seleniivolatilans TaxID=3047478 RepID=A0ABY9M2J6_9BURK|nr:ankyrin repeat domain-containing protein [Achromobacter sp. R39]WMD20980.1 ankyrin repeat domain-containing protein [Achromobacter sp. R39]